MAGDQDQFQGRRSQWARARAPDWPATCCWLCPSTDHRHNLCRVIPVMPLILTVMATYRNLGVREVQGSWVPVGHRLGRWLPGTLLYGCHFFTGPLIPLLALCNIGSYVWEVYKNLSLTIYFVNPIQNWTLALLGIYFYHSYFLFLSTWL